MKIIINNHRKIFSIQEEFNEMFPCLKIDFFAKPNTSGGAPSTKLVSHNSKTLQDCRAMGNEGSIEVQPSMNISDLKENFRDIFGLSVEITQKNGNGSTEIPLDNKFNIGEINQQYCLK
jgi:hypothetical protein